MAPSRKINHLFRKLAREEERFLQCEFLVPALPGGRVRVKIAEIVCELEITPKEFTGWGIFQPTSFSQARFIREASLSERKQYLELLPLVRLILCHQVNRNWYAIPAHQGAMRLQIEGMVPVHLAEEVELFDSLRARFDGSLFWFEELETRTNPAIAHYLRGCSRSGMAPEELAREELTIEQRRAYSLNEAIRLQRIKQTLLWKEQRERDRVEQQLRNALEHAGAEYVSYFGREDSYRVTYLVEGREYVTAVDPKTLTVQMAGICLNGEDEKFDLNSMVGVLREAH